MLRCKNEVNTNDKLIIKLCTCLARLFSDTIRLFLDTIRLFSDTIKLFSDTIRLFSDTIRLHSDTTPTLYKIPWLVHIKNPTRCNNVSKFYFIFI